jgi:hypothetical protein
MKIRVCLKFEVLFFSLLKSQKYQFLQRTRGLAEIVLKTVKCICLKNCQHAQKILECIINSFKIYLLLSHYHTIFFEK